jgi:hypothetical protein
MTPRAVPLSHTPPDLLKGTTQPPKAVRLSAQQAPLTYHPNTGNRPSSDSGKYSGNYPGNRGRSCQLSYTKSRGAQPNARFVLSGT